MCDEVFLLLLLPIELVPLMGLQPFRRGARPWMQLAGSFNISEGIRPRPLPRPSPLILTERKGLVIKIEDSALLIGIGSCLRDESVAMTRGGAAKR